MEKELKSSTRQKNTGLIVLVVILSLLVGCLGGFIIYDKVLSTNGDIVNDNNKKLLTNEEAIIEGKRLYDKVTEIYETRTMIPYCGTTISNVKEQDIEKLGDSGYGNGNYFKSSFSSLDALKDYLKQWLSEDIVNTLVKKSSETNGEIYYNYVEDLSLLSNKDEHYGYVDYVLKDNTLYCRLDSGKGYMTLYQNEYNIKVVSIEEDKIEYIITSKYGKSGSECYLTPEGNKTCGEEDMEYRDTTFVIEKNTLGNFVVTDYTLHN